MGSAAQTGKTNVNEGAELPGLLQAYYQDSAVRNRMCEFLGGSDLQSATAVYVTADNGSCDYSDPALVSHLPEYLEAGLEIERSLWDQQSLLVDIDLEYDNFDFAPAPWLDPARAFALQQPVLDETLRILGGHGIAPLILLSGRGFHLVWRVSRESRAFRRMVELGRVVPSLQARYAKHRSPTGSAVEPELGLAFTGLGMVLEMVGHRVMAASVAQCPVQLTSIEVGPGPHGREIVSFDLSEYGDPLHTRHIRLPFSAYLKPRRVEWALGQEGVRRLLPMFTIPLQGMTVTEAIDVARDPAQARALARRCSVHIPDQSGPMESLIDYYQASDLAAFHNEFYSQPLDYENAPSTGVPNAPQCVQWLLEHPNDSLLKPGALQHVARVLTALDWKPRDIARLICACYQSDSDWRDCWVRLDPMNRATFYTRLFTGMIATGIDRLIDLNCVSHKEKGYCMIPECSSNLVSYRDMLLKRRAS